MMTATRKPPLTAAERRKKHREQRRLSAIFLTEVARRQLKAMRERFGLTNEGVIVAALNRLASDSDVAVQAPAIDPRRARSAQRPRHVRHSRGRRDEDRAHPAASVAQRATRRNGATGKVGKSVPDTCPEPARRVAGVARGRGLTKVETAQPDLFALPPTDGD